MSMIKMRNGLAVIMAILLIVQSCSINKDDKEVIVQVDQEFNIDLYEILGNSRQLVFNLESIELQPCLNSGINKTVIKQIDKISLHINGIEPANDCNPGSAPATAAANVGAVQNKTYDFLVSVRNTIENVGKLTVTDESYTISLLSNDGVNFQNHKLNKIPSNFIWGYYAFNNANLVGNAPFSFVNDISQISHSKQMADGYFGQFSMDAEQKLTLSTSPEYLEFETFFYKFNGNDGELVTILENYRNSNEGPYMELAIFTSDGKIL